MLDLLFSCNYCNDVISASQQWSNHMIDDIMFSTLLTVSRTHCGLGDMRSTSCLPALQYATCPDKKHLLSKRKNHALTLITDPGVFVFVSSPHVSLLLFFFPDVHPDREECVSVCLLHGDKDSVKVGAELDDSVFKKVWNPLKHSHTRIHPCVFSWLGACIQISISSWSLAVLYMNTGVRRALERTLFMPGSEIAELLQLSTFALLKWTRVENLSWNECYATDWETLSPVQLGSNQRKTSWLAVPLNCLDAGS